MTEPDSVNSGKPAFQYRRFPAVQRKIADINPEKDIRVRILGTVIDKQAGIVVIDDGSSKAEIIVEEGLDKISLNDTVRVFCRVLPLETGYELRAEIVQNLNGMDMDLYNKITNEKLTE